MLVHDDRRFEVRLVLSRRTQSGRATSELTDTTAVTTRVTYVSHVAVDTEVGLVAAGPEVHRA